MEVFKRYAISFTIAGVILYFFTIWVEEQNEAMMPHNLSNKTEEKLAVILPPKRYYEKCMDVSENQQLVFNFYSQSPLSFNLHYHDEGEIFYEVKEESVSEFDFKFKPENRAYYCLKWGNPGVEKVEIKYEFAIQNRSSN
tara:strand:- start:108 stop:527 length:420 start_codon:yes stop_codon:yes gene_type:complete